MRMRISDGREDKRSAPVRVLAFLTVLERFATRCRFVRGVRWYKVEEEEAISSSPSSLDGRERLGCIWTVK